MPRCVPIITTTLAERGPMTMNEIASVCALQPATVRHALFSARDAGLVTVKGEWGKREWSLI